MILEKICGICSIFDIRYSIFDIQYSIFDFQYSIFDIRYSIFDIQYSKFNFSDLLLLSYGTPCSYRRSKGHPVYRKYIYIFRICKCNLRLLLFDFILKRLYPANIVCARETRERVSSFLCNSVLNLFKNLPFFIKPSLLSPSQIFNLLLHLKYFLPNQPRDGRVRLFLNFFC